jgi:predicted nucleotidyltransferase
VSEVDGDVQAGSRGEKALYEGRTLAEWVPDVVEELLRVCEPERIVLYGSVARGDDGPDSDINLMVVLPELDYERRHETMGELRRAVTAAVPLWIFVTDDRECESQRDAVDSDHYWPLREGRLVYERPS